MIRAALLATTIMVAPAAAEPACVDVSLVLLADVSSSMDASEQQIQREGYAEAFRSASVIDAIMSGYCGAIAVTYVEFASEPHLIVDWTVIQTDEDAEAFSHAVASAPPPPVNDRNNMTGLANALRYAGEALERLPDVSGRQVVDLSSDGTDNVSKDTLAVRDRLITTTAENGWREITINGLLVGGANYNMTAEEFEAYFEANIVGGPGHFLIKAASARQIPEIVRRKLVEEIG